MRLALSPTAKSTGGGVPVRARKPEKKTVYRAPSDYPWSGSVQLKGLALGMRIGTIFAPGDAPSPLASLPQASGPGLRILAIFTPGTHFHLIYFHFSKCL